MRSVSSAPSGLVRFLGGLLLSGGLLLWGLCAVSRAQITLDGSLGPRVPLPGPDIRIPAEVGQIRGPNLFHSFGEFNVPTQGRATFTGPQTITNILSRVTGGNVSHIDGTLRSEIAGANLYLLNPSGVMFGPNARLDVSGSFHVSTADYLRLADGARFVARLSDTSTLSMAPPVAFGFLGPTPAAIAVQGSTLQVPEGQTLSMVGGDIAIAGQGSLTADSAPTLGAPGGRIHLASVASAGEVPVNLQEFQGDTAMHLARVALSQGALLDASGDGGGVVRIRSGRLMVDQAAIFADNQGKVDGTGLGVDLESTAEATITNGALITTDSLGAGRARDLRLTAGNVHIDGSFIGSRPVSSGDGGKVTVDVGRLTLTGGARISTNTQGEGHGGALTVMATDTISIAGTDSEGTPSGLFSLATRLGDAGRLSVSTPILSMDGGVISTGSQRAGRAGDIRVEVGRLTLTGGAIIDSSTIRTGQGGTVTVTATDSVTISGRGEDFRSGFLNLAGGQGDAGHVTISAPTLSIMNGGIIRTTTLGAGRAGDIEIKVGRLTLTGGGQIETNSFSVGPGGTVTVTATDSVTISGRSSDGRPSGFASFTFGRGEAGKMAISAPTLRIDDDGIIATTTLGTGHAGAIVAEVGQLTLTGRALIDSSTALSDRTGGLLDSSLLQQLGLNPDRFRDAVGSGPAGNIELRATDIQLTDRATISATSFGLGTAGNLHITARDTFRSEHSVITTEAEKADGGNITLSVGSLVHLIDSKITALVRSGVGSGGNITIDPQFVVLDGSQIRADAFGGPGGNIHIGAGVFLRDPASLVSASSALGIQGTVDIRAPITNISGTLVPLPQAFARATELLSTRCAERLREGTVSSLVVRGRDGVPARPGRVLPMPLALARPGSAEAGGTAGPPEDTAASRVGVLQIDDHGQAQVRGWQGQGFVPAVLALECAK